MPVEPPIWLAGEDDAERIKKPDLQTIYRYWLAACPAGADLPARRDIDPPIDLRPYLPTMIIFDVEESASGPTFRYRLLGTEIVNRVGSDFTGRTVEECYPPGEVEPDMAIYREVMARRRCRFGSRVSPIRERQDIETYTRLIMPLASPDGRGVGHIWLFVSFDGTSAIRTRNF